MGESGTILIDEIEKDALDESAPVATALRKCLALGGFSGSQELRDWATRELKGYSGDDELPQYRVVPAPLRIDGIAGNHKISRQAFPPSGLPNFAREHIKDEVRLRDGIGGIEALIEMAEIKLSPPMASDLVRLMNSESGPGQHIDSLYWQVSHASIRGVIDQIRTALVQFTAELRANMEEDGMPSEEAATQAINVVVNGERPNININAAQAGGSNSSASTVVQKESPPDGGFWTRPRRIGAFIVGVSTVAAAVLAAIQVL